MIRIEYPALPPKEFSPNSRVHWSAKSKASNTVKQYIQILLHNQYVPSDLVIEKATVRIRFGLPDKRRRDLDNLIASSKPMLDALPLADDNVRKVKVEYDWFESPRAPKTIIEIEEE